LFFFGSSASAQNSAILAMLKQISLLETYIGYLEKGYDIARKGLKTIGDIKDGHWKMDTRFFNSLKNVNPKIKGYVKVAAIMDEQVQIVKLCSQLKKQAFNNDEVSYINSVVENLLNACETLVDELINVITDQKLQMSDDERIKGIDRIYDEVQDQYSFIKSFSEQAKLLIRGRLKEHNDINVSKKLRGL
jgi:hypothetical protein